MNSTILNRDFKHPEDGWYHIEPLGEHPNRVARMVQVIDGPACEAIATHFNRLAESPGFSGMLIDHEHFSHDQSQETRAYGWLLKLQNRTDGLYGQIKWTRTGQEAVDGGDYRFFSTEYNPVDLVLLNQGEKVVRVRPVRLDGLTLTNKPNNKKGKPITNRGPEEEFRDAGASASSAENQKDRTQMKNIASKLGLSADASEETVLAAVTTLQNRATKAEAELTTITNRVTTLQTENGALVTEQIDGILAAAGVKEEKVLGRLKPVLLTLKNRAEREEFVKDLVPGVRREAQGTVLNRSQASTPNAAAAGAPGAGEDDEAKAQKILNRANELRHTSPTRGFDECWNQATRENK